jgi:SpoVK/Ycf46/Vps4 family AAA+-type ATPase
VLATGAPHGGGGADPGVANPGAADPGFEALVAALAVDAELTDAVACVACAAPNRARARFCRACGAPRPAPPDPRARDPFAELLGVAGAVAELRRRLAAAGALVARGGRPPRLHQVVLGRPGSGKTRLVGAFADACRAAGLTTDAAPLRVAAAEFVAERDVPALLARATGRVLVVEDAHQLVSDAGAAGMTATQPLARLVAAMERLPSDADPIVVLAGHPGLLDEHLKARPELTQRFPLRFVLPDLAPRDMAVLAARELAARGMRLAPDALARLLARCRYLQNRGDGEYLNGYAVQRDVEHIVVAAAARAAEHGAPPDPSAPDAALVVTAADVPTPVHVVQTPEAIFADLDRMVGMGPVRAFLESLLNQARFARARAARTGEVPAAGQPAPGALAGHIMLLGNPGTGKTTVARLLARIFGAAELLPTERVVEVDRGTLVGEFVGQTAKLVHKACDAALGGVLFIDEAYDLWRDKSDTFGTEAVTTLLKRLEDDRGRFVCVVAGYAAEMDEWLKANPGLERRFPQPFRFTLPDYSDAELAEIFRRMAADKGLGIAPGAERAVEVACAQLRARATKRFGNAGEVRNLVDRAERLWTTRVRAEYPNGDAPALLTGADLGLDADAAPDPDAARRTLDVALGQLVGLAELRETLLRLADNLAYEREEQLAGRGDPMPAALHWTFVGNPGTGKTAVARLMGRFFHAVGLLRSDRVVEVDAKDLIGQYLGETKQKATAVIDRAMGGVLFIDEAHQLAPPRDGTRSYNQEAIDVLVKRMEDDRGKFVVIAAGYPESMNRFLDADPGLPSRFTKQLRFPDYTPAELVEITRRLAAGRKLVVDDAVATAVGARCEEAIALKGPKFGNARFARKLLDATIEAQRTRLMRERQTRPLTEADRLVLHPDDVPASALPLV